MVHMGKRIEIDGRFYRERRGVLVEIPKMWVNKVPTPQTINKRPSKQTNRQARELARSTHGHGVRLDLDYFKAKHEYLDDANGDSGADFSSTVSDDL
jgi:hypothetical protein